MEECEAFLSEHGLQDCLDANTGKLDTRKAAPSVNVCMRKFVKIDIKGQI
jgi:hypothetical protein